MEQNICKNTNAISIKRFYGRDVTMEDVVGNAKRYPMMADRQVVVVREAQELSRTIDKLESYAEKPTTHNSFSFAYKYKT